MEKLQKYVDKNAEINIHLARGCDFADIMAMSRGLEGGFDYLPASYWSLLHDPRSFIFVGVVKNKVVSVKWMSNKLNIYKLIYCT